jgi:hypothetical protein
MSNGPITPAGVPEQEEEEEIMRINETHVSFRIKNAQIPFFKRMIQHFHQAGYIEEPRLSLLGKACLNIVGHQYEKQEELAMAAYMQKKLDATRGPTKVSMPQYQRQAGITNPAPDYLPKDLQKPSILGKQKIPEWTEQH